MIEYAGLGIAMEMRRILERVAIILPGLSGGWSGGGY